MSDDGSITVAQAFCEAAQWPAVSNGTIDLRKIIGVNAEITSPTMGGAVDAALNLARLIDPTTRQMPDGSCERCGTGPEALRDQYCAHCGRRVLKGEEDEATGDATKAIDAIHKARTALYVAIGALGNKALRELVLMGYSMKLSDAISALFDIEEIARRGAEEDAE